MKFKKIFQGKLLEEIIKIVIISILYLAFDNVFFYKQNWWASVTNFLVILLTSVIYLLIASFVYIFKRPIQVNVELANYKTQENETQIRNYTKKESLFNTIIIKMSITERESVWSKIALRIIRNKKIFLGFFINPHNNGLICLASQLNRKIVEQVEQGFYLCINDHLYSNLSYSVPVTEEFNFIIDKNRDISVNNVQKCTIKPVILCNKLPLNFFIRLFIKLCITSKEKYHTIKVVQ